MARTVRRGGEGRLSPRTAALLAYVALWISGLVVLLVEREDAEVRFHAWQSVIGLGGLWAIGIACWITAFLLLAVSGAAFRTMIWLGNAAWALMVVAWAVCLYTVTANTSWKLPLAGSLAERWAGR